MKTFLVIALCLPAYVCCGQLVEHFNDGNFTADPSWVGSDSHFIVNASQQLQLNNSTAGVSYLAASFQVPSLDRFEWEGYVKQTFSPSGSNYGRIYLASDQSNLAGALNGYYLQLGEAGSNDAVELFRQSGTVHTSICRASNAMIAASFAIRIRVTRSDSGLWTLYLDYSGGNSFVEEAHGTDATFQAGNYFGVYCVYTASNANKFFFDDLLAGPPPGDLTPPQFAGIDVNSQTELTLKFSEPLDSASALPSNFLVGDSIGYPVMVDLPVDMKTLKLTFSPPFLNGKQYDLHIAGVKDLALNELPAVSMSFRYFIAEPAAPGDIVFNELFPDPSPVIGLPSQEFVEIYNASQKAFDLTGWRLADLTTTATLPIKFILPGEYMIITATAASVGYQVYGNTLAIPDMPTLNNSTDAFVLRDPSGTTVDSVRYMLSWYQDDDKQQGGYTIERLNPALATNEPLNWMASMNILGGTPGTPNSVLGGSLDSKPPNVDSLVVLDQRRLRLALNEQIDSTSVQATAFVTGDGVAPSVVQISGSIIELEFENGFVNGRDDQLLISGIKDLAGNEMVPTGLQFRFFVEGEMLPGIILINEIMADPAPTVHLPEAEFIEIVNVTESPYDLHGWTLNDAISHVALPVAIILPNERVILTSTTNASKFLPFGRSIGVTGFPSLSNTGEPLTLKGPTGLKIDSVFYHPGWLADAEKSDGGWSLERLDQTVNSNEPTNWRASIDTLGGTPGRANSVAGMNPDTKPPTVDSLFVLNQHRLRLMFSEQLDSTSVQGALVTSDGVVPSSVHVIGKVIELEFAIGFVNGRDDRLLISGIKDLAGNEMVAIGLPFRFFVEGEVNPGIILINEIMADPAPTVHLPEAEFIEIVNVTESPYDLDGWTLTDATSHVALPAAIIFPHEHIILTSTTNASKFISLGRSTGVTGFPSLSNSGEPLTLKSPAGLKVDSIFYHPGWLADAEKSDGGWSLERLDQLVNSNEPTNWRASIDTLGGTPGRVNSVAGMNPDTKAPAVDSLVVLDEYRLRLTFNEEIDSTSARMTSFAIHDRVVPSEVHFDGRAVELDFKADFENGRDQRLSIAGVADRAGNEIVPIELPFRFFVEGEVNPGIILINEIMADPAPTVLLPEAEFIEIVNVTETPYDLHGWTLTDATSVAVLPAAIVFAHEHIILTSTTNASKFLPFGRSIGVTGFSSLSNTGEPLTLKSPTGLKIDSVFYHPDWLANAEKSDGGWSLERLDQSVSSNEPTNWRASIDTLGGTPGRRNSVAGMNPDTKAPRVESLVVVNQFRLRLTFSEQIDSASAQGTAFVTADSVVPSSVHIIGMAIELEFAVGFVNGRDDQLLISGIQDLAGNEMVPTGLPFRFFVEGEVNPGIILINEIMADPAPTVLLPEAEFVEIVNVTESPYELRGWTLTDAASVAVLPEAIIFPHERVILTSTTNASKFLSFGRSIGVTGFPSLSNSGEPLTLKSPAGLKVDSIFYHPDWLADAEKSDGGWSLERLDHLVNSNEPTNWRASIDTLGGTPGRVNSVAGMNPDTKAPAVDSLVVLDEYRLRLTFNEEIDSTSARMTSFAIHDRVVPSEVHFDGRAIELEFEAGFENGRDLRLSVRGIADLAGNEMVPTELPFRFFVEGEIHAGIILINEIMSDPAPTILLPEAEFIEIINVTESPYYLHGWTLNDATSHVALPAAIIFPQEHIILTSTTNASKFLPFGRSIGVTGFPSLSNSGEPLTLKSPTGLRVDSVFYHSNWLANAEKSDGGWSLERLDQIIDSNESTNWRASIDTLGGTPGRINSVAGMNPDTKPPAVDSLFVLNQQRLRLMFSEHIDSLSEQAAFVTGDGIVPSSVNVSGRAIELEFEAGFENGREQRLSIRGVTDLAGNEIVPIELPFRFFVEGEMLPGIILINEIMADPAPTVLLPEAEFIEIVNVTETPYELHGWTLTDAISVAALPAAIIFPHEHVILTSTTNATKFISLGRSIGVAGFPSLSNAGEPLALKSPVGLKVDSVFFNHAWLGNTEKSDGGWSLERLDLHVDSNGPTNWRASIDTLGGTPGRVNSVAGMNPDTKAPKVDSLVVLDEYRLRLTFSERIDSASAQATAFVNADGVGPSSVHVGGRAIELEFEAGFENGRDQRLSIRGVVDLAGNEMVPIELSFRFFVEGEMLPGIILINEIMADPAPTVLLPEAEFIEIINITDNPYDLHGWILTDATSVATLPTAIILPHEHVILTSTTNASKFFPFGRSIGVQGFPSLNNSGESLTLKSPTGLKVDSVFFHSVWLANAEKSDGGWSLERLDQSVSSNEPTNWRASIDTLGGTPGRINSVAGMNPDTKRPKVDSLVVLDQQGLRLIFSEQIDSLSAQAAFVTGDGIVPSSVNVSGRAIELEFEAGFENGREQRLSISEVADLAGNEMFPIELPFRFFVEGEIHPGIIRINEVMADPSPSVRLPEAEFIEIVNVTDNPYDLHGWSLTDATSVAVLPAAVIFPHEHVILTSTTNASKFINLGRSMGVTGFPSLSNTGEPLTLKSPTGLKVDSVFYHPDWLANAEKSDGGWSLERLDQMVDSNEPTNWRASIDTLGGTPGRINSVEGMNPDTKPPTVDSLIVVDQARLHLAFSEQIDSASVQATAFVTVDGIVPSSVHVSGTAVELEFAPGFVNGRDDRLLITGIKDLAGNEMVPIELPFRFFVEGEIHPGIILINEIMADPAPTVYLPEAEFIEIVNVTGSPYDLHGWRLTDATSTAVLPAAIIFPNEHVILTSTTNALKFFPFGRAIGVTGFPSLSNTGEPLTLKGLTGLKIDSVFYHPGWLADAEKSDGGWSLERLDPFSSPNDPTNWRASIDTLGGTPGRINSVAGMNPDTKAPAVASLVVLDQQGLRLAFNEQIDSTSAKATAFVTGDGVAPSSVLVGNSTIVLEFEAGFENGRDQRMSISGITDLAGNEMVPIELPFRFFVEGEIHPGIVLINEIMADPAPTVLLPEAEFIEIVNVTDDPYDLHGWRLTDATSVAVLSAAVIFPHEHIILTSITNASKFISLGRSLGVTGFPSLSNSGEPLTLKSPSGLTVDSVFYQADWLADVEKSDGGWSLERIDHLVNSNEPTNWRASIDTLGGTPGRINSVAGMNPDTKAPAVDSLVVLGEFRLRLTFSEEINSTSARMTSFAIHDRVVPSEVHFDGRAVELDFEAGFENGRDQRLSITGVADRAGNEIVPIELPFRFFVEGEVNPGILFINEIMADPTPTVLLPEAEFIEIINVTESPYDLHGWTLADATSVAVLPAAIIFPHEHVILTSTTNVSKFLPFGRSIGVTGFPSLSNTGEPLTLKSPTGLRVDSVFYHSNWLANAEKSDGGWSLERLDHLVNSNEPTNWRASIDTLGGTPGRINSVAGMNPDTEAPTVDSLVVIDQHRLRLTLSEQIDSASAKATAFITADGVVPSSVLVGDSTIVLEFDADFENGKDQRLSITGVADLAGNEVVPIELPFRFFVEAEIHPGILLINEIMADPTPTVLLPEAEFIEIVNATNNPYDLHGWTLTDATNVVALPAAIIFPHEHIILTSITNASKFISLGRSLGVTGFPSLSNSGEPLSLKSPAGMKVDSVFYQADWLADVEKSDGGWSLERLDHSVSSNEPTNWRASIDTLGGTPGRINSVAGMNPDTKPPLLDSLRLISDRELLMVFSEPLDTTIACNVYRYSVDGMHPTQANTSLNRKKISIRFAAVFPNGIEQHILISGLKDLAGNEMPARSFSFMRFVPGAVVPHALLINEIMADPAPVVQLPEAEFIELVNVSSLPFNLGGWTLSDATSSCSLPGVIIQPGELLILTSAGNAPKFAETTRVVGVTSFPSLNNGGEPIVLRGPGGVVVDSVYYDIAWFAGDPRQDGGWTLERLRYNFASSASINWRPSNAQSGGTPGAVNSQFNKNPDDQQPRIVAALAQNASLVVIRFNEWVEPVPGAMNIRVDSSSCKEIQWSSGNEVRCLLENNLVNGVKYTLSLTGVRDTADNVMPLAVLPIRYFVPSVVNYKDIIINEIMADPSPAVGQPEIEYLELYNRSQHAIQLQGWELADNHSSVFLPDRIVQPDDYVVLTTAHSLIPAGGRNWLEVGGTLSLNNEGEYLVMRTPAGDLVDSINFNVDWFRDREKRKGGWSLELIDPSNPCGEEENWAASEDDSGGTPGRSNSILASKPDVTGPHVMSIMVLSSDSILVKFNEKLSEPISSGCIELNPGSGEVVVRFTDQSRRAILATLENELELSTPYELKVRNLHDCNGNPIDNGNSRMQFTLPEDPLDGDVVINEILFNPRSGGPDFIEIYNRGSKYVDLSGWKFVRTDHEAGGDEEPIGPSPVLAPKTYRVFTTDSVRLQSEYPKSIVANMLKAPLPSLPDDKATVTLIDDRGKHIDSIDYDEHFHSPLIRDREGVSLERISMTTSSFEPSNWRSAAESAGFATPGFLNSNSRDDYTESAEHVVVTPEVISFSSADNFASIHYQFDEPGNFVSCRIFDAQGRLVKEVANNVSVGTEGFLRWDGDQADGGRARTGYYIVLLDYFNTNGESHSVRKRVAVAQR